MTEVLKKEEWFHCNDCGRNTLHSAVYNHRNREFNDEIKDDWGNIIAHTDGHCNWQMFECGGCKTIFLRLEEYFSEWWDGSPGSTPYQYTLYPKRNTGARTKPHWFDTFSHLQGLHGHFILISYKQIYELIEAEQHLAALLTARALLETLAIEHGKGDKRTFEEKLKSLRDNDFIRDKQIDFLNRVIYDAGSAAMHRSYNPSPLIVAHVLDAIEHLLHTIYIEPLVEAELQAAKPAKK